MPRIDYTPEQTHQAFRHSHWRVRRIKTYKVLSELYPNSRRLDRFENCGSQAFVLRSREHPNNYRIRTNRCRDRLCEPCAREKRTLVGQNLARSLPPVSLRLMTLTLKSRPIHLREQLARLLECFRKLRAGKEWRRRVRGGVYFMELTINVESGLWHPHLHCIYEGSYFPLDTLRKLWHTVTRDSFIVDLQFIKQSAWVAGYVAKYAGKTIPPQVWNSPKHLTEAAEALEGKRTFSTFGTWREFDLSKIPDEDDTWVVVGTLHSIIIQADHGHPEAIYALRQITAGRDPPFDE